MRYRDILLAESRMKEVATVLSDLRDLPQASAEIVQQAQEVVLQFVIDGQKGVIRMRIRPGATPEDTRKGFRSKIYAAAMSMTSGRRPADFEHAAAIVAGAIRNRAIRILTNTENWVIAGMRYGDLRF